MVKNSQICRREKSKTHLNSPRMKVFLILIANLVTILLFLPMVSAVWASQLDTDLYAYYTFNETTGTVASDSFAGKDGNVVNHGDGDWIDGLINNSILHNGSASFINFTDKFTIFRGTTTSYSISFWVRNLTAGVSNGHMLLTYENGDGSGNPANDIYVYCSQTAGVLRMAVGGGTEFGTIKCDGDTDEDTWHHIVLVKNSTSATTYIDGVLNETISESGNAFASNNFTIAKEYNLDPLVGYLDEMGLWNRSLTDAEVTLLYNSGSGITYGEGSVLSASLNSPANNTEQSNNSVVFNITGTDDSSSLVNISLYFDGGLNQTLAVTGTSNTTAFLIENIGAGNHTWYGEACNATECATSSFRNISILKYQVNSETFSVNSVKGASEIFIANITLHPDLTASTANFHYNGSITAGSIDVFTNDYILTETITIPEINGTSEMTFFWNVTLDDGTVFQTPTQTQSIGLIGVDDCSSFSILLLNFTLVDENAQTLLVGATENTTVEVDIGMTPRGGSVEAINFSGNFTKKNSAAICLETNLNSTVYDMDVEVKYGATAYNTEFYNIQNYTVTNSTAAQNITLYDLKTSDAQIFKITYKDENFLVVDDALIKIQKKYIDEGLFKTVEIPKTNTDGEAPASLEINDAVYTMIITKNGEVLATFNNVIATCQNPSLQTCEINLNSFATSISPTDFTVGDDFSFTLTYTPSTRTIESIYSIPSGGVSTVLLNVTLFDQLGGTEACSNSLTSSSGTLSCIVPTNLGNGTVVATITKDGTEVGKSFISLEQEPEDLYGVNLVFISLILILLLVGIGIVDNPMITGIFFIIGAVMLIAFNLVDTGSGGLIGTGSTVLWLIIAIVIVLIKGAKRT